MHCAAFDYQGHGYSEGQRNRVESLDSLVDDLLHYIDTMLIPTHPTLPIFLRGQSLGGLVALRDCVGRSLGTPMARRGTRVHRRTAVYVL